MFFVTAPASTFSGRFALFLLFVPLFFKKCVQTDIFTECSCFSSLRPRRRSPDGLHSFCCLCLYFSKNASKPTSSRSVVVFRHCARVDVLRTVCTLFAVCASVFSKNASKQTSSVSVVAFRCHVRASFLGRRLALAFCYWRSVLAENARKQALLGLVFSCFAFLMFLFPETAPNGCVRRCSCVLLYCLQLCFPTVHSAGAFRQVLQGGLASDGLCRVGFTGSACTGRLRRVGLYRVGFAGLACVGSTLPGWLCRIGFYRVGLRSPARTRARGGRSHRSLREVCLTVKHINALNRCFIE